MPNIIGTKQYLAAVMMNKKTGQIESKIVKVDSSNSKLVRNVSSRIENSVKKQNKS